VVVNGPSCMLPTGRVMIGVTSEGKVAHYDTHWTTGDELSTLSNVCSWTNGK
jgi:hypothetical protein